MYEDIWKTVGGAIGGGGLVAVVAAILKYRLSRGTQAVGSRRMSMAAHLQILDRQERQIQQLEKRHEECLGHHRECLEKGAELQAEIGGLREKVARLERGSKSAVGIVMANDKGYITSWNRGAMSIFHYIAEEALGKPITMVMPERYRARHLAAFRRLVAAKQPPTALRDFLLPGLTREGEEVDLTIRVSGWDTGDGWTYAGEISRS